LEPLVPLLEPMLPRGTDVVGGADGAKLDGGAGVAVADALVTGGVAAEVFGGAATWLVTGGACAVVIRFGGSVCALTGGGAGGNTDRLGALGETLEDVGAGALLPTTPGATGVSARCPPKLSTSTPISTASGNTANSSHRRARLTRASVPSPLSAPCPVSSDSGDAPDGSSGAPGPAPGGNGAESVVNPSPPVNP
jgi:hypothetical protein